jgi:hypothetical protein
MQGLERENNTGNLDPDNLDVGQCAQGVDVHVPRH